MPRLENIQCSEDARQAARRRLPWMLFDFIDGGAGEELATRRNREALARIELMPRVLVNVEARTDRVRLPGSTMGPAVRHCADGGCATWRGQGRIARSATLRGTSGFRTACRPRPPLRSRTAAPVPGTTPGSSSTSARRRPVGTWCGAPLDAGYEHLVLTVDTPVLSRRRRELRRGFKVPFRLGPSQILDFAVHPRWSLATLAHGVPRFGNNPPVREDSSQAFDRSHSRGAVDWAFLRRTAPSLAAPSHRQGRAGGHRRGENQGRGRRRGLRVEPRRPPARQRTRRDRRPSRHSACGRTGLSAAVRQRAARRRGHREGIRARCELRHAGPAVPVRCRRGRPGRRVSPGRAAVGGRSTRRWHRLAAPTSTRWTRKFWRDRALSIHYMLAPGTGSGPIDLEQEEAVVGKPSRHMSSMR